MKIISRSWLALPLLAAVFSFTAPQPAATDFSGNWKLNEGKSELGQFGTRGSASKIEIKQTGNDVSITRHSTGFDGNEQTTTENLTADGKEVTSTVFGTAQRKATMKWADDQKSFSVTTSTSMERGGQSFSFDGKEVWSLSADGKTLTLQNTVTTPQGEFSTKAVYDKQ
jgi:hypothetical protein